MSIEYNVPSISPEKPLALRDGDPGSIDVDVDQDDIDDVDHDGVDDIVGDAVDNVGPGDTIDDHDLSVNSERVVGDGHQAGT